MAIHFGVVLFILISILAFSTLTIIRYLLLRFTRNVKKSWKAYAVFFIYDALTVAITFYAIYGILFTPQSVAAYASFNNGGYGNVTNLNITQVFNILTTTGNSIYIIAIYENAAGTNCTVKDIVRVYSPVNVSIINFSKELNRTRINNIQNYYCQYISNTTLITRRVIGAFKNKLS